ncbi:MAG: hypothetical protein AAB448_03610 [Patescibacteria group bacterium]
MKRHTLEEGISDYIEEKEDATLEKKKKINEIIDLFYTEGLERGKKSSVFPLKEKLASLPSDVRLTVFKEWLLRDPVECLWQMDEFEQLPSKCQKDIIRYLSRNESPGDWVAENILKVFDKITDRNLHAWIINYGPKEFSILAEYRSKLPYSTDEEILKRAHHNVGKYSEWFDWAAVVPYVDTFTRLDKDKVIEEVLTQKINQRSGVLLKNRDKLGVSERQLIDAFYQHNKEYDLVDNLEYIGADYHQEIAERCIKKENISAILRNAGKFQHVDVPVLLRKIADIPSSDGQKVIGITMIERELKDVARAWGKHMPQDIVNQLIERNPVSVAHQADRFGEKINKDKLAEILFGKKEFNNLVAASEQLGIERNATFANRIIEEGGAETIFTGIDEFSTLPRETYIRLWEISPNKTSLLITKFEGLTRDDVYWAIWYLPQKSDVIRQIINQRSSFDGLLLNKEFAHLLIERGESYTVAKNLTLFEGIADDRAFGERLFKDCFAMDTWNVPVLIHIFETYKPPLDKIFALTCDILGEDFTKEAYTTIQKLKDGTISSESLSVLGITGSREAGVRQLRECIRRFKSEILEPSFDAKTLRDRDFYAQYYKAYVRFTESEYGKHSEQSFDEMVSTFIELQSDGELRPLPDEYKPSGEIRVKKVDKELQKSFRYSEQFLSRYETLQRSVEGAVELLQEKKPLLHIVRKVEAKRKKVLMALQEKLQQLTHPKARENLNQDIAKLQTLNVRSVKDFQDNFSTLAQFGEFDDELRQLTFYYALHKNENYQETARHLMKPSALSFDDVSSMMNFVGHIVNEETWNQYFSNKQAQKIFERLISTRALEEEFARAQNQASQGTTTLEFLPTRGLLMEFSGHIADVCWASQYESIAQEFPNFSAIIMVQNKGQKHERLAGAAMMIETEAKDRTALLVIRGLNPIENVINSLSVKDFVEKFTIYAREIAKKAGRQLAIVIDEQSAGSGTNRPVLFRYLEKKKETLQKITLKSEADTTFNGYNIVDNTYLL